MAFYLSNEKICYKKKIIKTLINWCKEIRLLLTGWLMVEKLSKENSVHVQLQHFNVLLSQVKWSKNERERQKGEIYCMKVHRRGKVHTYSTSNLMLKIIAFQRNVKLFHSFIYFLLAFFFLQFFSSMLLRARRIYFFMKLEITRKRNKFAA